MDAGVALKDKREECGCHRTCTTQSHWCAVPCVWPSCLTPEEQQELTEEIRMDMNGWCPAATKPGRYEPASPVHNHPEGAPCVPPP